MPDPEKKPKRARDYITVPPPPSLRGSNPAVPAAVRGPSPLEEMSVRDFDPMSDASLKLKSAAIQREQKTSDRGDADAAALFGEGILKRPAAGAGIRAGLSFLADNPVERDKVFKKTFPNGNIYEVGEDTIVIQTDPSKEPILLDKKGFAQSFNSASELFGDVADATPELFSGAVQALATRYGGPLGGKASGFISRAAGQAIASGAAEAVRQGSQTAAGTQAETPEEQAARVAREGVIGAVGEGVGTGATRVVSKAGEVVSRGLAAGGRGSREALEAQKKLGMENELMFGQVTGSAFLGKIHRQVAALSSSVTNKFILQQRELMTKMTDRLAQIAGKPVASLVESREIINLAEEGIAKDRGILFPYFKNMYRSYADTLPGGVVAGKSVAKDWFEAEGSKVDALYAAFRALGENPQIDYRPLQETFYQIQREGVVVGRNEMGQAVRLDFKQLPGFMQEMITRIQKLNAKDPNATKVYFENIIEDRKRLANYAFSEGADPATAGIAKDMWRQITEVIDVALISNPGQKEAWEAAKGAASNRFRMMDTLQTTLRLSNRMDPTSDVARIYNREGFHRLSQIRAIMGPERFREIQAPFLLEVLQKENPAAYLDSFDRRTTDMLLGDLPGARGGASAKALVEIWAKKGASLDKSGVVAGLRDQSSGRQFIEQVLINNPKGVGADEMFMLITREGGKDSNLGRGVRSALIDNYLNAVTRFYKSEVSRNQGVVSGQQVAQVWSDWERRGLTRFFTQEDREFLTNWNQFAKVADSWAKDSGAAMQAGEIVSDIWTMDNVPKGAWNIAKAYGLGWLVTTPATSRFLTGSGKAPGLVRSVGEMMMRVSDNPIPVMASMIRALEDRSGVDSDYNWSEELRKKYRSAEPAGVTP